MLENRPIVTITIGYILGIIMGLYCKISIVFLYLLALSLYLIFKRPVKKQFKIISFRRYFRYVKIIFTKRVILIVIISSIISNSITILQNLKYKNLYSNLNDIVIIATVVSNPKEKDFKYVYKVKVESINSDSKYKDTYLYLNVKKNANFLIYGSRIKAVGNFIEPTGRRNYKGFDYKEYLKTLKIYGSINSNSIELLESKFDLQINILKISNNIFLKIKDLIQKNFNQDISSVLLGLTLGYTDEIDEDVRLDFSESNMSHILAVSGMHVGFLILGIKIILEKIVGKRINKIVTAFILLIYMFITGFSPSVVRACIMAELLLGSFIIYRKNDVWTNLSLSFLILLVYNPFLIENVGVLLTFAGMIGIMLKPERFKSVIAVTIFVMLAILPIIAIFFNKIAISSILIGCISGILVGPIVFLMFAYIILRHFLALKNIISFLTNIILRLVKLGSQLPLNKVYVAPPSLVVVIIYYFILFLRFNFVLYLRY